MSSQPFKLELPKISSEELSPLVKELLRLLEAQQSRIGKLEDEIMKLKGGPGRPTIKPSKMDGATDPKSGEPKGRGKPGRGKTAELVIDEDKKVPVEGLPEGSRFKGYRPYVVQDPVVRPHTTRYLLEQWETPEGRCITASVPASVNGGHFGPTLASYVLHQYHHNHVTQPLLLEQLRDFGIVISAGQLNRMLVEDKEVFHKEKAGIKEAGLAVSRYVQTDDTGARHAGRNGYCTYIGNDLFAWFESTFGKSRVNFLELLQTERSYVIDANALAYMAGHGVSGDDLHLLESRGEVRFSTEDGAKKHLKQCGVLAKRATTIAIEGALVGGLLAQGLPADIAVLSDDAGQFNVFAHALCWIHAERGINRLTPLDDAEAQAIDTVRSRIWDLYAELKRYKLAPDAEHKARIEAEFDAMCAMETACEPLNAALLRFQANKDELLLVLERPELPLHNNLSESDIREYVKKRKISSGTRSDEGRRCRDTFATLKKTCRKHGLCFWEYLNDRVAGSFRLPPPGDVIPQAACRSGPE